MSHRPKPPQKSMENERERDTEREREIARAIHHPSFDGERKSRVVGHWSLTSYPKNILLDPMYESIRKRKRNRKSKGFKPQRRIGLFWCFLGQRASEESARARRRIEASNLAPTLRMFFVSSQNRRKRGF